MPDRAFLTDKPGTIGSPTKAGSAMPAKDCRNRALVELVGVSGIAASVLFGLAILVGFPGSTPAYAEGGCPPGYYPSNIPGVSGCAPIYSNADDADDQPEPDVKWQSRWGATALGGGGFGAASNQASSRSAKKLARQQCLQANQGKGCNDIAVYSDQCVAVAAGQKLAITIRAPGKDVAERYAVAECAKVDTLCEVYYSACSFPVRIR